MKDSEHGSQLDAAVSRRRSPVPLAVGVALVAAAMIVVALAGLALQSYEVVAKGPLPGTTADTLYRVRLLDAIELNVVPESRLAPQDIITSHLLTMVSTIALVAGGLLWLAQDRRVGRPARFYALVFVGAGYLAFDELAGIHETIG